MRTLSRYALRAGCLLLALTPTIATADYDPAKGPPRAVIANEDFEPLPLGDGPDWIRLTSGEWLKGDIDRMRNESLEFDSDELDDLNLDWGDISGIITVREQTLLFEDRIVVTGTLAIRDDVVKVRVGDEVKTYDRETLLGIIPGRQTELNYWSGKLSAGLSARSGNTDQTDISALARLTRETAATRSAFRYNGAFGELDGVTSINNHRALLRFDYFVYPRFYVTPFSIEGYKDELQNIDIRITPWAGVGYEIFDRGPFKWDAGVGVGYQYTEFTTTVTDDRFQGEVVTIFTTSFESDLTQKIEWDGEYKLQLGVPDTTKSNHHLLTTLSFDLIWDLDFDVTVVWDRVETPVREADGTLPERNDFTFTAGIGWDF
jgi:hypothetical protein